MSIIKNNKNYGTKVKIEEVQPGGGESYIVAYYYLNPWDYYNNTDTWGGRITNSLTNVIEEWIDGVQVTPMTEFYQFSMSIVHTVKFVYDPQHNETVANMFEFGGTPPIYVDWSHFTGTINYSGRVSYSELLQNVTKPVPLYSLDNKIVQQNTTDLTNVSVGIGNTQHACVVYDHPTLASYANKIIYYKRNNQILKYYSGYYESLYVPEFLSNRAVIDTTALGGVDRIERYCMNSNIAELHTATNGGSMIFTGTTPPNVIDFVNEIGDTVTIFVPNSSQQAYRDKILNTSTQTDMSKFNIKPVCKFKCEYDWTAAQQQDRGSFYVVKRDWGGDIVKLYDAQDNLVAELAEGGMAFNPSNLPAYGRYRADLYRRNYDGWEFPDFSNDTDAVKIDASDVYYTRVGDWRISGLNYLEELIMPASATDLSYGFLWNCPRITKVTLLSQSVPTINTENAFLADGGATRPCPDVFVYDVAAYRADGNWSYLENDGRINLVQAL